LDSYMSESRRFARFTTAMSSPHVLPVVLYLLLTIVFTYPLILHMNSASLGRSDALLQMWAIWWRKYTLVHGLDYHMLTLSQMPFATDNVKWFFRPIYTTTSALVAIPFGEIVAFNLSILFGIALSGILAYVLAYRFTRDRIASFMGGAVFAFSPFAWLHTQHGGFSQKWVLPLFVLLLLLARKRRTWWAAGLLGVSFVLAFDMHGYYGYFATLTAITFALVEIVVELRKGGWRVALDFKRWGLYGLAVLTAMILYSPILVPIVTAYREGPSNSLRPDITLERDRHWFFYMSSRPWLFFTPPRDHPVLGSLAEATHDYYMTLPGDADMQSPAISESFPLLSNNWFWHASLFDETYLGYIAVALCLYGLILLLWRRQRNFPPEETTDPEPALLRTFLPVMLLVALLFSLPPYLPIGALLNLQYPTLHNLMLPTPSWITMQATSALRGPGFLIVLITLLLGVLVSIAICDLKARLANPAIRSTVLGILMAGLTFEYAHPLRIEPIDVPEEFRWLADQPHNTLVAVFPYGERRTGFYQIFHERPVIDSPREDPLKDNIYYIEQAVVGSLDHSDIAAKLAALGVKYVINTDDPVDTPPDGLTLVFSTETAQVYAVEADPAALVVLDTLRDGLWQSPASWQWETEEVRLYIWNPLNRAVDVDITLSVERDVEEAKLAANLQLSEVPSTIVWSGVEIPNPLKARRYREESIYAMRDAAGFWTFQDLSIKRGETVMGLRWRISSGDTVPRITGIEFEVQNKAANSDN
jgi:hypothetical protein